MRVFSFLLGFLTVAPVTWLVYFVFTMHFFGYTLLQYSEIYLFIFIIMSTLLFYFLNRRNKVYIFGLLSGHVLSLVWFWAILK